MTGKILMAAEAAFIFGAVLMMKLHTERGTKKELIHSHVFDKSAMCAVFMPLLYLFYHMYMSMEKFRVIPAGLFIFFTGLFMFLLVWDTKAVNRQHKEIVASKERMKKSKEEVSLNEVKVKPAASVEEAEEMMNASKNQTEETGLSPEEILKLVREERGENPYAIDGSLIAQQVMRDFKKKKA